MTTKTPKDWEEIPGPLFFEKGERMKTLERYMVIVDGIEYATRETEKKAKRLAADISESCMQQDEPYLPQIEIRKECLFEV